MRAGPHVNLVFFDGGVASCLESSGVVLCESKPSSVVHAVCPGLAVWLAPLDRANVVRLPIVVPGQDFNDINCVSSLNKRLPALGVKMLV